MKYFVRLIMTLASLVLVVGLAWGLYVLTRPDSKTTAGPKTVQKASSTPSSDLLGTAKEAAVTWKKYDTELAVPILMYHHIADCPSGDPYPGLWVSRAEFESQMRALHDAGYYTLSPQEAVRVFTQNEAPSDKLVWVTLDDGYQDNVDNALPILKELGQKAQIAIITSWLDQQGTRQYWQDVAKNNPNIALESHTVTHPDLGVSDNSLVTSQLTESKQYLDSLLGQSTSIIVYPSGRYNDATASLAQAAGYQLGLTTDPGLARASQGLFTLNRVRINPGIDPQSFLQLIAS